MIQPTLLKDFYKADHRRQYPQGTTKVYSNFTPRITRDKHLNFGSVVFGVQAMVKEFFIDRFYYDFFRQDKSEVVARYKRIMDASLGPDAISVDHIAALHDLGHLPVKVKALPEGTICPLRVPMLTITNTRPEFSWVPNFLETLISCELWPMCQSATIAAAYRRILNQYAAITSDAPDFVNWQGHDFSMRGHRGVDAATKSGAAHLIAFTGTDTIPAIDFLERHYLANAEMELIGGSVPATEHSVMCLGISDGGEKETFRRLIKEVYPKGIVSVVSDTLDYFEVLTKMLPELKDDIMNREGKLVIRPDSGDPVLILCGDPEAPEGSPERKGSVELLWEVFGGKWNSRGFRELDPHIGLIYGDSITMDRCETICKLLMEKQFASTNVVFGIGSYTYQYNTRDTLGFAMKATYGEINGVPRAIYKDPKTDGGVKKSAKGLLMVDENLVLHEEVTAEQEESGMLQTVFEDGRQKNITSLAEIRRKLAKELERIKL